MKGAPHVAWPAREALARAQGLLMLDMSLHRMGFAADLWPDGRFPLERLRGTPVTAALGPADQTRVLDTAIAIARRGGAHPELLMEDAPPH